MKRILLILTILCCVFTTAYGSVSSAQTEIDRLRTEQAQAHETAEVARNAIEDASNAWWTAQSEIDALQAYIDMVSLPVQAREVVYSDSLLASDAVKQYGNYMGNYKLSFYCPCAVCNGTASGKTASGTTITEGRTIAVDSRYIPLGSKVYMDGWGLFIAEDTGGAIKGNRIDVGVDSHKRAYELGIKYADVYVLEG